jgi:2,3-bisphosphoglycerate-independent phosphoglycerate mutase
VTEKLAHAIREIEGTDTLFQHVKEYRASVVFRGRKLDARLTDSDPQKEGLKPLEVLPTERKPEAEAHTAARLANSFIARARQVLADEPKANFVMMRGFDLYVPLPDFCELYKWRAMAIAAYPMYKGVAKLAGMKVIEEGQATMEDEIRLVERELTNTDFLFLHIKKTDSMGEDGNFPGKVEVLEHLDHLIPQLTALKPDVLCVTFHPVPVCIWAKTARRDPCSAFNETELLRGGLGRIRSTELMALLLAHAGRLMKFGA